MIPPCITIRRTLGLTPEGSEVLIDGQKIPGVALIEWVIEPGDIDMVTLKFKARVTVEHIAKPAT